MGFIFYHKAVHRKPYQRGAGGSSGRGNRSGGERIPISEVRDRIAAMVAEILYLLPGMDFQILMDMGWEQLSFWHGKAVEVHRAIHGGK